MHAALIQNYSSVLLLWDMPYRWYSSNGSWKVSEVLNNVPCENMPMAMPIILQKIGTWTEEVAVII